MRRFNWRKFRRKGLRKLVHKDVSLLERKVPEIKTEITIGGTIRDVSREVLPEE